MLCAWILGLISVVVVTQCARPLGRHNTLMVTWWWCCLFGLVLGSVLVVMILLSVRVCQALGCGL